MTLALSGQNNLASSRNHKDKKVNPNCELCGVKENSEHVIIVCPRLDELKHKLGYKKKNHKHGGIRRRQYQPTKTNKTYNKKWNLP